MFVFQDFSAVIIFATLSLMEGVSCREKADDTEGLQGNISSGEYNVADLVRLIQVQNLIEKCIQLYMKKSECKHALQIHYKIDPYLTEIMWNRLENKNEEFFRAYYVRLVLMQQIEKFNILLEQQVQWMQVITLSGVPAPMNTFDPSPDLIRQQASPPSASARQNRPLNAEDMQKLHECHKIELSIQPSPQGFINAPFCDRQNTEMHSVLAADALQNTGPSRTVDMRQRPMTHEFGSPITSLTLRMGDVPFLAPQCPISYGAGPSNPGYFQENVYMSGYDPNFRSSQYLVDPQNQDAAMTQTGRSVSTRKAGYGGSLAFNPGSYGCFAELSALTGDAYINSLSSYATDLTNLNEGYMEGNAFQFYIS